MPTRRLLLLAALARAGALLPHARPLFTRACQRRGTDLRLVETFEPQNFDLSADPVRLTFEPQTFEPQLSFDPVQLAVLAACAAAPFAFWWYYTVPDARRDLAKDKRKSDGQTFQYLEELAADDSRPLETWFFAKWLRQAEKRGSPRKMGPSGVPAEGQTVSPADSLYDERTELDDGVRDRPRARQVSLRELLTPPSGRTPRFFSGDNPIVVVTGALMAWGVAAALLRGIS